VKQARTKRLIGARFVGAFHQSSEFFAEFVCAARVALHLVKRRMEQRESILALDAQVHYPMTVVDAADNRGRLRLIYADDAA
jgi:hypothetical protein